jgi:hypothetical protein
MSAHPKVNKDLRGLLGKMGIEPVGYAGPIQRLDCAKSAHAVALLICVAPVMSQCIGHRAMLRSSGAAYRQGSEDKVSNSVTTAKDS